MTQPRTTIVWAAMVVAALASAHGARVAQAQLTDVDQPSPAVIETMLDQEIARVAGNGTLTLPREALVRMVVERLAAERLRAGESRGHGAVIAAVHRAVHGVVVKQTLRAPARAAAMPAAPGAASRSIVVHASGIPASERQALIDLYNATGGLHWYDHSGWNGPAGTECSWYGVTCDSGGTTVQQLYFGSNGLVGMLPTSLGSLTNLQSVNLNNNQLTGSIPTSLGSLTNLQSVILNYNQLTGSIPTQLGSLTNLFNLDLGGNQLTGSIPTSFGSLTGLVGLTLNGNMLSGAIPTSLENLTDLHPCFGPCGFAYFGADLTYNALYSTDATLTTILNGKQNGGDWQSTQTVAPTGVTAGATTSTSVALSWMPITYTGDTGGYQSYYSTTSGGPYTAGAITADKSASSIVVSGLNSGTQYYFVVRTITSPNANNQNTVTSDPSAEVHAKTGSLVHTLRRHLQRTH